MKLSAFPAQMPEALAWPRALRSLRLLWPLMALLLALALTAAFWRFESQREQTQVHQAFDRNLQDLSQRFEQQLNAQRQILQGLQGFLAAYPQADEAALRLYAQTLPPHGGPADMHALLVAWAQPGVEEPARLLRLHPGPGAPVRSGSDLAKVSPSLLTKLPQLPLLLTLVRDEGRLGLSGRLDLRELQVGVVEGYLQALPVFRGAVRPSSEALRREHLLAWVLAPIDPTAMFAGLYPHLPEGLSLALYTEQHLQARSAFFRSAALNGDGEFVEASEGLQVARTLRIPEGENWTLVLQAGPGFAPANGAGFASQVPWLGGVLSLMLSLLVWSMLTSRERAQHLAERMTEVLRETEQRWAFALEGAGDGVWEWQVGSGQLTCSLRWKAIMGISADQAEPSMSQLRELIHPQDVERVRGDVQRCLDGVSTALASEYRVAGPGGQWLWVLSRGMVVRRDEQGQALTMVGTLSDIHQRRQTEEQMRYLALHDPLTDLANRAHFAERFRFALANARRYQERIGLILLDLDRFKPINDQYGHAVGDQLLQTVARRIKAAVRETDTVGRIGGDEFVVLLTGPMSNDTAQLVVEKIFNQVSLPIELNGLRLELTCSLGLAIYPQDGQDELSLAKSADDAMYRNKREGRKLMGEVQRSWPFTGL
nr:diguanylate cyclase [uncultured Roseateles sp.]